MAYVVPMSVKYSLLEARKPLALAATTFALGCHCPRVSFHAAAVAGCSSARSFCDGSLGYMKSP